MSCLTIGARRVGQIIIGASLVCDIGSIGVTHIVLRTTDDHVLRTVDERVLEVFDEED